MELYLLEYCKELTHEGFKTEEYNLVGLYPSEEEAQNARKAITSERQIGEEYLVVSATRLGKVQWRGGFVSV